LSIFQNAPPTASGTGKPLDSDARARAPIFGAGIPAAGCPAKQNGRRLRNGRQRPLVCIWVLGEGRRFRIPDPRRGAAGEQTAARVEAIILDINRFVSDAIPDADIEVFYKTLTTITQNLQLAVEKYGRETLE